MNKVEIQGFFKDFHADYEGKEPGRDATRHPRIPVGIALREPKRSRYEPKLPKHVRLDTAYARSAMNTIARIEAVQTADEVEDALIAAIDIRRHEQRTRSAKSKTHPVTNTRLRRMVNVA
jgi:hypothetical protein